MIARLICRLRGHRMPYPVPRCLRCGIHHTEINDWRMVSTREIPGRRES